MAAPDLRKWWNQATPLCDARDIFIPSNLENRVGENLELISDLSEMTNWVSEELKHELPADGNLAAITALIIWTKTVISPHSSQADIVHHWIVEGKLTVLAYTVPRKHSDKPVIIDTDSMDGLVKWSESEIIGNGLHYVAARVHAPVNQADIAKRCLGRPSVKEETQTAFLELVRENSIDWNAYQNACYDDVRIRMARNNPSEEDKFLRLSDVTINAHIRDLYNEEKAKASQ